jgi:hypothetical protein
VNQKKPQMITLCHQNSYDETLSVRNNIEEKKLTILYIHSRLYFEAASDFTGIYIYACKNFASCTIIIFHYLTNKSN